MAKKKVAKKVNWFALIPAFAAVAAIILATFLTGVRAKVDTIIGGTLISTTVSTVSLIGMIFGSGTAVSKTTSDSNVNISEMAYDGGMSIFGLIAFILLVLGIIAIVAALFVKGKKLDLIGSALIVLGGICLFLLLVAGTDLSVTTVIGGYTHTDVNPFKDAFAEYSLGAGVYICAILSILGGLFGAYTSLKAKK